MAKPPGTKTEMINLNLKSWEQSATENIIGVCTKSHIMEIARLEEFIFVLGTSIMM